MKIDTSTGKKAGDTECSMARVRMYVQESSGKIND